MKKVGLEFKVGLFVLAAIAILVGLVLKAGDFYLKPGYQVRFFFDSVSGVDVGSPVRLAGVNVGETKSIRVVRDEQGETQVEVSAWISQGVFIEDDAKVAVNSLGLLGEKYIEILPGTGGHPTLSDGGTLIGSPPVGFEDLIGNSNRLIHKIEFTMDNLNQVAGDPEFKAGLKGTFVNADVLTRDLRETTDDLKDAAKSARIVLARLRDGEGSVGRLLKNDKIARDLEDFVADIKAHPWKLLKKN